MSAIVPFDGSLPAPAYLAAFRDAPPSLLNADVLSGGPSFPVLSIKGKNFTLVKDSERKLLTREIDGEVLARQSLTLAVVRANTKARAYYMKQYVEGEDSYTPPDCQSDDGVAPTIRSTSPQATKCAICPHSVWGTGDVERNVGRACGDVMRLAVIDPENPGMKMMLRVPPASRKSFTEAVKQGEARKIPYNAMVYRVSFDTEIATPKLVFKPVGLVSDELYTGIQAAYASDEVLDMMGRDAHTTQAVQAPALAAPELDAAIAAKAAVTKAALPAVSETEVAKAILGNAPAPRKRTPPAPAVEVAPPPVAAPAPAPRPMVSDASNLLGDLDALLGTQDD